MYSETVRTGHISRYYPDCHPGRSRRSWIPSVRIETAAAKIWTGYLPDTVQLLYDTNRCTQFSSEVKKYVTWPLF